MIDLNDKDLERSACIEKTELNRRFDLPKPLH